MDSNAVHIKPEPSPINRNHLSLCSLRDRVNTSPTYSADPNEVAFTTASNCVNTPGDRRCSSIRKSSSGGCCPLPSANDVDFFHSETVNQTIEDAPSDSLLTLPCISASLSSSVEHVSAAGECSHALISGKDAPYEAPDSTDMSIVRASQSSFNKPSETLFVRALIGRCKRIAPLWFRGVSSMRERNREENRRMATNSGQTQSDWSLIGLKIAEMDTAAETDAVANLLKKLYKELPADSVFWFLKCWLCSDDSLNDPDSCVISRGDAKGRMRRIDGGKGSDKVWRLDTIVGMLYHGLPMSSTDTNIMVHTCDQELCVRPQHIRFRASSVALVVVLKALAQAGYTVVPPKVPTVFNGVAPNASDESVDVFGPFSIDELQRYRSENLLPPEDCNGKLSLSDSDREFAESVPVLRAALMPVCEKQSCAVNSRSFVPDIPHINGYHQPYSKSFNPETIRSVSSDSLSSGTAAFGPQSVQPTDRPMLARLPAPTYQGADQTTFIDSPVDIKPSLSNLASLTNPCVSTTVVRSHHPDRRSLKRPAPSDTSCSFHSSSPQPCSNAASATGAQPNVSDSNTPPPPSVLVSTLPHSVCHRRQRLSGPTLPTSVIIPNPTTGLSAFLSGDISTSFNAHTLSFPGLSSSSSSNVSSAIALPFTAACSEHPSIFATSSTIHHSVDLCNSHQSFATQSILRNFQPNVCVPCTLSMAPNSSTILYQPYPLHQPSAPSHPLHLSQSGSGLLPGSVLTQLGASRTNGAQAVFAPSSGSNSGKTTPRQPAKKRLEARTPTIDGTGEDSSCMHCSHSNTPNLDDSVSLVSTICSGPSTMAFRVHQNTPFVPVQSRSGRPSSSGSSSSTGGFQLIPVTSATGISPSVGSFSRKTSHSGTFDGEPALFSTARVSVANTAQSDDEEEELVGIMVGRSVDSILHTSSDTTSTGDHKRCNVAPSGNHPLIGSGAYPIAKNPASFLSSASFPEVGRSPPICERHVIEMIGALLANSTASPSFRRSSHANSRRSASANSLPYVGTSPNENLPNLTSSVGVTHSVAPVADANSSPSLLTSSISSATGKFPFSTHPEVNADLSMCDHSSLFLSESHAKSRVGCHHNLHSSTPPPRLTPISDLDSMRTSADPQSVIRLPALQPLQLNGESNPGQELVNLIRNSPASGITPELIDMLYNMAQQYGVHQPRTGSRASRSSSQVAQNFYRSLINGSVCSSPFPTNTSNFGSFSNVLNVSNTACQTDSAPVSSAVVTCSSILSPTSCSMSSTTPPVHHLRGLSFTPLSVDPEQTTCSSTTIDWTDTVSASQLAPVNTMQPPYYSSRTVTQSHGLTAPSGPTQLTFTSSGEGPYRQPVKH